MKKILSIFLKENNLEMEILTGYDGMDIIKYVLNEENNLHNLKCIITDENMDFLNGSEAIKLIRNLERRNRIKHVNIISITCHEDTDIINYILDSGADGVLSKPLTKNSLNEAFRNINIIN